MVLVDDKGSEKIYYRQISYITRSNNKKLALFIKVFNNKKYYELLDDIRFNIEKELAGKVNCKAQGYFSRKSFCNCWKEYLEIAYQEGYLVITFLIVGNTRLVKGHKNFHWILENSELRDVLAAKSTRYFNCPEKRVYFRSTTVREIFKFLEDKLEIENSSNPYN